MGQKNRIQKDKKMEDTIRILIVEDEEDLCEIIEFNLAAEGFSTESVSSAEEALGKDIPSYSLFILDVMMGRISGFRLAEKIRKEYRLDTPIIFLTARDSENDRLTGFSLGADDYIPKPFSVRELVARVKAILKRQIAEPTTENELVAGEIVLNRATKRVESGGKQVELTRKEYDLLRLLLENKGRIFARDEILDLVWGGGVIVTERTVDVNVARIRNKLGSAGEVIMSKPGFGYYINTD